MVRSKRTSRAFIAANTFGTLGYISLIFQWAWTGLILAYPIITQAKRDDLWLFSPSRQKTNITPIQPADFGAAMPIISVLAIAFAAILIVMSIVAVIRLPKNVGKTGAKLTQSAADVIVPIVAHTENVPKAKRKRLSFQIIVMLKCVCTVLALALLLFARPIGQVTFPIIWAVGIFCFVCTMVYWLIQYIIARAGRVPQNKIW